MKHRGLKFLSLLLTLALLVGLLPGMTAFAADDGTVDNRPVYLPGDTIETGGKEFYIAQYASGNPEKVYEGKHIYKGLGTAPRVASAEEARVNITAGGTGNVAASSFVYDENEAKGSKRTPIGVRIASSVKLPEMAENQRAVILELVYDFTVTYDPGDGSGSMNPTKVEKNAEGKFMYKVESCGFTAPEGETFDYWLGSDKKTYRPGPEVEINGDLTLTAQWKEKSSDGGSGSGGADIVFNIPGVDNSWEYVGGGVPQRAYRVSLAPMQGGSAALGLTTGESGTALNVYPTTTVYVFPNAEQGYVLDKIVWSLIDGSASYDITEAKNFVMPAMDAVVNVTFRPAG